MTSSKVLQGLAAIDEPEVQALVRRLGDYGLGVTIPHQHADDEVMTNLAPHIVQYEDNLQVSFVGENDPILAGSVPVAWMWDSGLRIVGRCRQGHGGSVPPPQM